MRRTRHAWLLAWFLAALLAGPASAELRASLRAPAPRDAISPQEESEIRRLAAAARAGAPDAAAPLYRFFPQGGIEDRDLYLFNFTDLDPSAPAIRDWDCSQQTYDGHQGHDSGLRSFREQDLGVPVFAVADGAVLQAHDGEDDHSTDWNPKPANYVILDHGGGYTTLYWHLRRGSVAVALGQAVAAGTQLGLTGSSGISTGPHLHFESRHLNQWFEPSVGPCHAGSSSWLAQPPVPRDLYLADSFFATAEIPCCDWPTLAADTAPRTGTFVAGARTLFWVLWIHDLPGGSTYRFRVLGPRGVVAHDESGPFGVTTFATLWIAELSATAQLTPGAWKATLEVNGTPFFSAPFTVVAAARQVKNRPPLPIKARFAAPPAANDVVQCQVVTTLGSRDPDYDLVRYRYRWMARGRIVRNVTTGALSDVLAKGILRSGDRLVCQVTPSDGQRNGPSASATAAVR